MRILVTGVCGNLGSAVAREAAAQGVEVVGVDLAPWDVSRRGPVPATTTIHAGTYEDLALVHKLMPGCEGLIHTAGPHGGHVKTLGLDAFLESNVVAVARLLDAAVQHGVRAVALSSTMEVQVGADWSAHGAAYLSEETPGRGTTSYSLSRFLVERLGQEFARMKDIGVCSLRYMSFGYWPDEKLGLTLLGRGLSAGDVARVNLLAVQRTDLRGEVFNIGPDSPLKPADIGRALVDPAAVLDGYYPGASAFLNTLGLEVLSKYFWPVTSIHKAKLVLGWRPRITFESWLRSQGWTPRNPQEVADAKASIQTSTSK